MTTIFVAAAPHTCADCITNSKAGSQSVSPQLDKMGQTNSPRVMIWEVTSGGSDCAGRHWTTEGQLRDLPPDRPPLLLLTAQITSGGWTGRTVARSRAPQLRTSPPATWEPIVMRRAPSGLAYLALSDSLLNISWTGSVSRGERARPRAL